MPRLVKAFPALWLPPDAITTAIATFERLGGRPVLAAPCQLTRDHEVWDVEDVAAFVSAYERGPCTTRVELGRSDISLVITCTPSSTTVVIRHPNGAAIKELDGAVAKAASTSPAGHSLRVFIGHGRRPDWRMLGAHLASQHGVEVATYENRSRVGQPAMSVLSQIADDVDFAVLVHTAEVEGANGLLHTVPNVVHETGYFQARLGHDRALIVREDNCQPFTNIGGLTAIRFSAGQIAESFGQIVARLPWDPAPE